MSNMFGSPPWWDEDEDWGEPYYPEEPVRKEYDYQDYLRQAMLYGVSQTKARSIVPQSQFTDYESAIQAVEARHARGWSAHAERQQQHSATLRARATREGLSWHDVQKIGVAPTPQAEWSDYPTHLRERRLTNEPVEYDEFHRPVVPQGHILRPNAAFSFSAESLSSSWLGRVAGSFVSTFSRDKIMKRIQMFGAHPRVQLSGRPSEPAPMRYGSSSIDYEMLTPLRGALVLGKHLPGSEGTDPGPPGQSYLDPKVGRVFQTRPMDVRGEGIGEPMPIGHSWEMGEKVRLSSQVAGFVSKKWDYTVKDVIELPAEGKLAAGYRFLMERSAPATRVAIESKEGLKYQVQTKDLSGITTAGGQPLNLDFMAGLKDVQGGLMIRWMGELGSASPAQRKAIAKELGFNSVAAMQKLSFGELAPDILRRYARQEGLVQQIHVPEVIHRETLPSYKATTIPGSVQPWVNPVTGKVDPERFSTMQRYEAIVGPMMVGLSTESDVGQVTIGPEDVQAMINARGVDDPLVAQLAKESARTQSAYSSMMQAAVVSLKGGKRVLPSELPVVSAGDPKYRATVTGALAQAEQLAREEVGAKVGDSTDEYLVARKFAEQMAAGEYGKSFTRWGKRSTLAPFKELAYFQTEGMLPGREASRLLRNVYRMHKAYANIDEGTGQKFVGEFHRARTASLEQQLMIAESKKASRRARGFTPGRQRAIGMAGMGSSGLGPNEVWVPGVKSGTTLQMMGFPTQGEDTWDPSMQAVQVEESTIKGLGLSTERMHISEQMATALGRDFDADLFYAIVTGKVKYSGKEGVFYDLEDREMSAQAVKDMMTKRISEGAGSAVAEHVGSGGEFVPAAEARAMGSEYIRSSVERALSPEGLMSQEDILSETKKFARLQGRIGPKYQNFRRWMYQAKDALSQAAVRGMWNISHGKAQRPQKVPTPLEYIDMMFSPGKGGGFYSAEDEKGRSMGVFRGLKGMQMHAATYLRDAVIEGLTTPEKAAASMADPGRAREQLTQAFGSYLGKKDYGKFMGAVIGAQTAKGFALEGPLGRASGGRIGKKASQRAEEEGIGTGAVFRSLGIDPNVGEQFLGFSEKQEAYLGTLAGGRAKGEDIEKFFADVEKSGIHLPFAIPQEPATAITEGALENARVKKATAIPQEEPGPTELAPSGEPEQPLPAATTRNKPTRQVAPITPSGPSKQVVEAATQKSSLTASQRKKLGSFGPVPQKAAAAFAWSQKGFYKAAKETGLTKEVEGLLAQGMSIDEAASALEGSLPGMSSRERAMAIGTVADTMGIPSPGEPGYGDWMKAMGKEGTPKAVSVTAPAPTAASHVAADPTPVTAPASAAADPGPSYGQGFSESGMSMQDWYEQERKRGQSVGQKAPATSETQPVAANKQPAPRRDISSGGAGLDPSMLGIGVGPSPGDVGGGTPGGGGPRGVGGGGGAQGGSGGGGGWGWGGGRPWISNKELANLENIGKELGEWGEVVADAIEGTDQFNKEQKALTKRFDKYGRTIERAQKDIELMELEKARHPDAPQSWHDRMTARIDRATSAVSDITGSSGFLRMFGARQYMGDVEEANLRAGATGAGGGAGSGGGGVFGRMGASLAANAPKMGTMGAIASGLQRFTSGWELMRLQRLWSLTGAPAFNEFIPAAAQAEMAAWQASTAMGGYQPGLPGGVAGGVMQYQAAQRQGAIEAGRGAYGAWGWTQQSTAGLKGLQGVFGPAAGAGLIGGALATTAASLLPEVTFGAAASTVGLPVTVGLGSIAAIVGMGALSASYSEQNAENALRLNRWASSGGNIFDRLGAGATMVGMLGRQLYGGGPTYQEQAAQMARESFRLMNSPLGQLGSQDRASVLSYAAQQLRQQKDTIWSGMSEEQIVPMLGQAAPYGGFEEMSISQVIALGGGTIAQQTAALGQGPEMYGDLAAQFRLGSSGREFLFRELGQLPTAQRQGLEKTLSEYAPRMAYGESPLDIYYKVRGGQYQLKEGLAGLYQEQAWNIGQESYQATGYDQTAFIEQMLGRGVSQTAAAQVVRSGRGLGSIAAGFGMPQSMAAVGIEFGVMNQLAQGTMSMDQYNQLGGMAQFATSRLGYSMAAGGWGGGAQVSAFREMMGIPLVEGAQPLYEVGTGLPGGGLAGAVYGAGALESRQMAWQDIYATQAYRRTGMQNQLGRLQGNLEYFYQTNEIQDRMAAAQNAASNAGIRRAMESAQLQYTQGMESLGMGRRIWGVQTGFQREQFGVQWQQMQQAQEWGREDMAFNRQMAGLEFGWQQEDLDRSIRFATGRQKEQLIRQRERGEERYAIQEGRRGIQEERQETVWQQQEEQFARQVSHFEELKNLETEQYEMQKRHLTESFEMQMRHLNEQMAESKELQGLQQEMRDAEREHQEDNLKYAISEQEREIAFYEEHVFPMQIRRQELQDNLEDANAKYMQQQIEDMSAGGDLWTAWEKFIAHIKGLLAPPGGEENDPAKDVTKGNAGSRQLGGPVFKGMTYRVGESGPEPFVPDTDGYVYPSTQSVGGINVAKGAVVVNVPAGNWNEQKLAAYIGSSLEKAINNLARDQANRGQRW